MPRIHVTFFVEREPHELELDVTAWVSPYEPATSVSPAEGGAIEVEAISFLGAPWLGQLTGAEVRSLDEAISEAARDVEGDYVGGGAWEDAFDFLDVTD